MSHKLNTSEFIDRARSKHGSVYDYSKVSYFDCYIKVCIICPIHGEFFQSPTNHLNGSGCPFCGRKKADNHRRITFEEFVERSNITHDKKFSYERVIYKGNRIKACIVCPVHGEFFQTPKNHLRGDGCSKCADDSHRSNREEFIEKAKSVHGDKYKYSKVIYKGWSSKVCIICPTHGDFYQTPKGHLGNLGCFKCAVVDRSRRKTLSLDEFLIRANTIHGKDRYDYSKVIYKKNFENVIIICPDHGEFFQAPANHINGGQGCPICKSSKGEKAIEMWLTKNNIEFKHGHLFRDLNSPESGKPLIFDFFIWNMHLLIEYDGVQHFKPTRFNGISMERAFENLKKVQSHDELKNQYCVKKSIPLLRIPYTEFKRIPEILTEHVL